MNLKKKLMGLRFSINFVLLQDAIFFDKFT